jgi:hypothetical protein
VVTGDYSGGTLVAVTSFYFMVPAVLAVTGALVVPTSVHTEALGACAGLLVGLAISLGGARVMTRRGRRERSGG